MKRKNLSDFRFSSNEHEIIRWNDDTLQTAVLVDEEITEVHPDNGWASCELLCAGGQVAEGRNNNERGLLDVHNIYEV